MVNFKVEVKVEMENVELLHVPEQLCFTVQQSGGTETRSPVFLSTSEQVELDNGRSSANFKLRWEGSKKDSFANFIKHPDLRSSVTGDDEEFVTIAVLECRGLEPVEWHLNDGFAVTTAGSGTKFDDVKLAEGDWYEYDEAGDQSEGSSEEQARESFASGGGSGGGDPACSYHTNVMKQCMMEDPDGTGEYKMVCKTVKQVFESCPGKPSREIERTETQEDAPEAGLGAPQLGHFNDILKEFDNMIGPEAMLDPRKFLGSLFGLPDTFMGFPGEGGGLHGGRDAQGQGQGQERSRGYRRREQQEQQANAWGGGFRYQAPHRSQHESEEERESARREAHYETNEI